MAINLQKGQKIDIGLTKMTIGLGWDPNEGTGADFDLDASAFMIDENRLIPSESFFVFYGNTDSPDASLRHTGDDPTGGNSADGDDESIEVDLSKVALLLFPVGFVNVVESKQYGRKFCDTFDVPGIIMEGRFGSSTMVVATLHAIFKLIQDFDGSNKYNGK